jgi:acetyl-CoA C-acetyltransferase
MVASTSKRRATDGARVGIVGMGHTTFGRHPEASVQELAFEAFAAALQDSGLDRDAVEGTVIAAVPEYHKQRSVAGVVSEYLGLAPKPTWLVEAACASGSAAIRTAWMAIRSGSHDLLAVIGCQKMTELSTAETLALMGRVGEVQWESCFGATFPAYYALFARRHMHEHGTRSEDLAAVAVKNHYYGARNPLAMFQKEVTAEKAMASDPVASPFHVYDCCANADGAVCLLLAEESQARNVSPHPVWLTGMGSATASMSVLRRPSLSALSSTQEAAREAYEMAGVTAADVDVADVHDSFTIAEILAYEDLGFCEKGAGGRFVSEGRSRIGGTTPVNVDGGLKAKGHPIGATGVSMTYEIAKQLRGEAGERQVPNATVGLTHNVGGIGQYCFVQVLTRE